MAICFHLLAYSLLHLYSFFVFCASDIKYLILPQLQELATQLIDLWNLMDTPSEERRLFDHVTCNISAYVDGVTVPGALALDLIEQVSNQQCPQNHVVIKLFQLFTRYLVISF